MIKKKRFFYIQALGLIAFFIMASASESSKQASNSIDWRGAAVGAAAGYSGYSAIGSASSDDQAKEIARSKGYSEYLWDSVNGIVYAK